MVEHKDMDNTIEELMELYDMFNIEDIDIEPGRFVEANIRSEGVNIKLNGVWYSFDSIGEIRQFLNQHYKMVCNYYKDITKIKGKYSDGSYYYKGLRMNFLLKTTVYDQYELGRINLEVNNKEQVNKYKGD